MKKCPYCAEEIQDEAKICRYCQRDVKPLAVTAPSIGNLVCAHCQHHQRPATACRRCGESLVAAKVVGESGQLSESAPIGTTPAEQPFRLVKIAGGLIGVAILLSWLLSPSPAVAPRSQAGQAAAARTLSSTALKSPAASLGPAATGKPPTPQPAPAPEVGSQWSYGNDEDEMSGKRFFTANVRSENTVDFSFPYGGAQHGRLTLRRHPRHGDDVIFAIERGQLQCPSYDGCTVLVRFDDGQPQSFSANPPADNTSEILFISNYARFLSKMSTAKSVRVSPKVYQQGNPVFTFDVSGFDAKRLR